MELTFFKKHVYSSNVYYVVLHEKQYTKNTKIPKLIKDS